MSGLRGFMKRFSRVLDRNGMHAILLRVEGPGGAGTKTELADGR
jgi:hypothetical protein